LVLQGRAVAAMRRRGTRGDFRANLHAGGTAEAAPPTPAQRAIAEAAATWLGLDIAGVDLLESANGPLLIEVNSSPGLAGISEATGLNLASEIMRMVVARASRGWTSAA
jgi:ribosomal protein S6--L-glutamate ligase